VEEVGQNLKKKKRSKKFDCIVVSSEKITGILLSKHTLYFLCPNYTIFNFFFLNFYFL